MTLLKAGAAILLATLAFLPADKADAADYAPTVAYCVKVVRNNAPQVLQSNPYFRPFDAYVDNPGTRHIQMYGTERDYFEFGKCMAGQGWPINKTH